MNCKIVNDWLLFLTAIYRRKTKFLSKLQHTLSGMFRSNMADEIANLLL